MAMEQNLREVKGRIHSIESFGAVDGPGVRFVVFFQGCPLRCLFCHNPDSWNFAEGEEKTAGQMVDQIMDYRSFIAKGGVTLSGGEPTAQPEFCHAILTLCKQQGLHTAIDTSGGVPLSVSKPCIDAADMLLLDIKDLAPEGCLELTGRSNENALEILNYCESVNKPIWVRHVCVPGYTLKTEKLEKLADFLKGYSCVEKVELIPFHQMGSYKWDYVDTPYRLNDTPVPTQEEMKAAKEIFVSRGLQVK